MIFAFFYYNLGKALEREDIKDKGYELAMEVLNQFYVEEKNAILYLTKTKKYTANIKRYHYPGAIKYIFIKYIDKK